MNRDHRRHPPRVGERLLRRLLPESERRALLGDYEELYRALAHSHGRHSANLWYVLQIVTVIPAIILDSTLWSLTMVINYLKIAFRNMMRYKGYSFINISGLTLGVTCALFLFLYIRYETSYDSHHEDADRVYRIIASVETPTGSTVYGGTAHQLTSYIKENLPQAEYAAKVTPWRSDQQVTCGNKTFNEIARNIPFADEDIFKILTFQFIQGDPESALKRPNTAVITEQTAYKYFGDQNPMGKTLSIGDEYFEVTGVIKDPPGNTVFKFNMVRSWNTLDRSLFYPGWMNFHLTFIKLAPGENPNDFASLLSNIITENSKELFETRNVKYTSILQPIEAVYLNSKQFVFERCITGNVLYVYVFSGIGLLILIIASINFINLTTAHSGNRVCEIGIRKAVGAYRKQIFTQFIGESITMIACSFIVTLIAVILLLDEFNKLVKLKIEHASLLEPGFILIIVACIIALSVAAGSYPALVLSSFKPLSMLRDPKNLSIKGQKPRKILIIGQYTLSIAMIIGAMTFHNQLNFMKNRPLGFEKQQKLILNMQETGVGSNNYLSVKKEFSDHGSVLGATFSSSIPGRSLYYTRLWPTGQRNVNSRDVSWIDTDGDFIPVYGLDIIAGRNLSDEERTRSSNLPGLFNETAVAIFGFQSSEEVVNTTFRDEDPKGIVIGVVKDFHYAGLQNAIEPLAIMLRGGYRYLTLKIKTDNIGETLSFVEKTFKSHFPGRIFDYFFLEDDFNKQYQREEQTTRIFGLFTLLGILIASLGLIGLAAFVTRKRTKEIGIRKTMGASSLNITNLLIKEFLILVLAANIIAWPVAYIVMNRWLQAFAYRADVNVWIYLFSGLAAVAIAWITVSYQSIKAATANPTDSLRYE